MNKKIRQLAELLDEHIYPYCKFVETPLLFSINNYSTLRITSKSVNLDSNHFTIYHLDILVVSPKNIMVSLPYDFDDKYVDSIISNLIDLYRKHIEPKFNKETRLKAIEEKKRLLDQEAEGIRNED